MYYKFDAFHGNRDLTEMPIDLIQLSAYGRTERRGTCQIFSKKRIHVDLVKRILYIANYNIEDIFKTDCKVMLLLDRERGSGTSIKSQISHDSRSKKKPEYKLFQ